MFTFSQVCIFAVIHSLQGNLASFLGPKLFASVWLQSQLTYSESSAVSCNCSWIFRSVVNLYGQQLKQHCSWSTEMTLPKASSDEAFDSASALNYIWRLLKLETISLQKLGFTCLCIIRPQTVIKRKSNCENRQLSLPSSSGPTFPHTKLGYKFTQQKASSFGWGGTSPPRLPDKGLCPWTPIIFPQILAISPKPGV